MGKERSFGWEYIHFIERNDWGLKLNIVRHETDIFGLEKKPYTTMMIKKPNMEARRFRTDTSCHPKDQFVFDGCTFALTSYTPTAFTQETVMMAEQEGCKSLWEVLLLGSANIKLTIDDKEKCFDGYIYSDKQWGSLLIQDWVKYWIWLHIVDTDGSHSVLFRTVDQNDEEKNHSAGSRIRLSKLPESFLSNPLQNHSLVASPNNISLSTRDIMRSRIDENYDYFSATYIRWGITNGLFEFMKIKK